MIQKYVEELDGIGWEDTESDDYVLLSVDLAAQIYVVARGELPLDDNEIDDLIAWLEQYRTVKRN